MTQLILSANALLNLTFLTDLYMTIVRYLMRRASVRRTITELSALSDRELQDMGVCRGSIEEIAEKSYHA